MEDLSVNKKMVCGVLVTLVGLIFSAFCFIYAALTAWYHNGVERLLESFLGTGLLIPFAISVIVMCIGLVLCFATAYRKER